MATKPEPQRKQEGESPIRSLSPSLSARMTMSAPVVAAAVAMTKTTSGPISQPSSAPTSWSLAPRSAAEVARGMEDALKAAEHINFSVNLVFAAKRQLGFLRSIDSLPCLHKGPAVIRAVRRYQKFWMPLVADSLKFDALLNVDAKGKSLLPPMDVQWVWHCHRLNPVSYRQFCVAKYGRVIDSPVFADQASESFAQERCRRLWSIVYQKEPYDIMSTFYKFPGANSTAQIVPVDDIDGLEDLLSAITRQATFYYSISQPHMWEDAFLQSAVERYKCFLFLMSKKKGRASKSRMCVPTFDIDLIWRSHMLTPVAYGKDTKGLLGTFAEGWERHGSGGGKSTLDAFEQTASLWESTFGSSYEKAGCLYRNSKPVNVPPPAVSEMKSSLMLEKPPAFLPWDHRLPDHNPAKYPVLTPRHVLQVCILIKCGKSVTPINRENADLFIRLRTLDALTSLKLETPVVAFTKDPQWQRLWVLQCEAKTKGVALELRHHVDGCMKSFQKTKRVGAAAKLAWADLVKAPSLSLETVVPLREKRFNSVSGKQPLQLRLDVSVTPPVQAPYLLKSVPDRVTDDTGAMLSTTMRRRNNNHPQPGRWITRTVHTHTHKEAFIIRIRAAKGAWHKGGERPIGVDWNERIINIHQGGWRYLTTSAGIAPDHIVATASPLAHELEEYKLSWAFSTGYTLVISRHLNSLNWERNLDFSLKTSTRGAGLTRLLNGRKQQYEVPDATPEEEEGFVTLIRYWSHCPQGKATALFNFKASTMEVAPEEDVVLVLLLCTATMRSIADFGGLSGGNEYSRERKKGGKDRSGDWGSVVLEHPCWKTVDPALGCWFWSGGGGADADCGDAAHTSAGPVSENKDWSGTDVGMVSSRTPVAPPIIAKEVVEETTPSRSITSPTPTRGSSGRRSGGGLPIVPKQRPLTFS